MLRGGSEDDILDKPGDGEKVAVIKGWRLFVLESPWGDSDISVPGW